MFNLGFPELIVIGVVALIFIGPKQLPEVARIIARTINEFKNATSDLTDSFKDVKKETEKAIHDTHDSFQKHIKQVESSVEEVKQQVEKKDEEPKHDS